MIFKDAENCGRVLFSLNIPHEDIQCSKELWKSDALLRDALICPAIKGTEKLKVIEKLFPESMVSFLNTMCQNGHMEKLEQIFQAYEQLRLESKNILRAKLYYVNKPDDSTISGFEKALRKKYNADGVIIDLIQDNSLMGGYKLKIGDIEYDKTIIGAVNSLKRAIAAG